MQESVSESKEQSPELQDTPLAASSRDWGSRLPSALEVSTRAGVLVSGLTYIIGLLIVSIHLSTYGALPLGFFAQQYITAGVWGLLPAAFGIASIVLISRGVARDRPLAHTLYSYIHSRSVAQAVVVLGALFILGLLGWQLLRVLQVGWHWGWVACYMAPPFLFSIIRTSRAMNAEGPRNTLPDDMQVAYLTGLAALTVVVYCAIFAGGPFRTIPPYLGGGVPIDARLLLRDPTRSSLRFALYRELYSRRPSQVAQDGRVSGRRVAPDSTFPVKVLMLTDDQILFLPDECRFVYSDSDCAAYHARRSSVILNRNQVDGIIWPSVGRGRWDW